MTGLCFVDSNVPVYRRDPGDPLKQAVAVAWMTTLFASGQGRISVQVLNETYSALSRRVSSPADLHIVRSDIEALLSWQQQELDAVVYREAWRIQTATSFHGGMRSSSRRRRRGAAGTCSQRTCTRARTSAACSS